MLSPSTEHVSSDHLLVERVVSKCVGAGTGEHGVGIGKKEFLYEELGEGTVGLMKTIKRAVDPLGLFNPGKVRPTSFSLETECSNDPSCILTTDPNQLENRGSRTF